MRVFEKKENNVRNGLFNWILLVLAGLQSSSQLLEFFIQKESLAKPSLLSVWISISNSISQNWNTFSISLVLAVLGYFLYKQLYNLDDLDDIAIKRGRLNTIFLSMINLALCNRIYSNDSISEKTEYISAHISTVNEFTIIILLGILGILFIKNKQQVSKELEKLSLSQSEGSKDDEISIKGNALNKEVTFRMRHPISYLLISYFIYTDEKRSLNYERRKANIRAKTEIEFIKNQQKLDNIKSNPSNDVGKKFQNGAVRQNLVRILTPAFSLMLTILTVKVFLSIGDSKNSGYFYEFMQSIDEKFAIFTNLMNTSESLFVDFLIALGIPFLLAIICFTIYLLFYIFVRLAIYLLINGEKDEKRIKRCAKMIKVFVFEMIDSVMQFVLFIPDFLAHLEEAILETDLDQKIKEVYPDDEDDN